MMVGNWNLKRLPYLINSLGLHTGLFLVAEKIRLAARNKQFEMSRNPEVLENYYSMKYGSLKCDLLHTFS